VPTAGGDEKRGGRFRAVSLRRAARQAPRVLSSVTEWPTSRFALVAACGLRIWTRGSTTIVIQDRSGIWKVAPRRLCSFRIKRPRAVVMVSHKPYPAVLGVSLASSGLTAYVLFSYWVHDPVQVLQVGAVAATLILRHSVMRVVRTRADSSMQRSADSEPHGPVATFGGLSWRLHQWRISAAPGE
jgi:hypothetical protein